MSSKANPHKDTASDSDDSDGVPPPLPPRTTRESTADKWIKTADGLIIPPPPSRRPSGSSLRTSSSSRSAASRSKSTRVSTLTTDSNSQAQPIRRSSTRRISAAFSGAGNKFRRSLFGGKSADTRQDSLVVDMDDSRRETMLIDPPPLPPRRGKRDLSMYMTDTRYSADSLEKNLPRMPSKATVASTSSSNEGGDNNVNGVGGEVIGYGFNNEKRAAGLPLLQSVDAWLARKHPRVYPYRHALYVSILLFFIGLLIIIICIAAGGGGGGGGGPGGSGDVGESGLDLSGSGDGTYYDPSIGAGSCGGVYQNEDYVAALNAPQYGSYANPNQAPVCGKCIKVTGPKGTVKVKIVDKCPVCKNGDVDMSPAAFNEIAEEAQGRVPITWEGC